MIVAFARTTAALIAGEKSVTRREWSGNHHDKVLKKLLAAQASGERGLLMDAWSAGPHRKGVRVGKICLLTLSREKTADIPDGDYAAEGFAYMDRHGINVDKDLSCEQLWRLWRQNPTKITSVLRFELVGVEPGVKASDFWPWCHLCYNTGIKIGSVDSCSCGR